MRKPRTIHMREVRKVTVESLRADMALSYPERDLLPCICGKKVHSSHGGATYTEEIRKVTCPLCIEILKEDNWYCNNCGLIDDDYITDEGICVLCGEDIS